jgi:DNA-binding LacI/PurR family transcriptional regulator
MMPTIRNVEKKTGVPTATVSRILGDSYPILPETRYRVWRAIEKFNNPPEPVARTSCQSMLIEGQIE